MNTKELARRLEIAAGKGAKGAGTAKIVDLAEPKTKEDAGYKRALADYTKDGKKGVIIMREYKMSYKAVVTCRDFMYVKTQNDIDFHDGYLDAKSQALLDRHPSLDTDDGEFDRLQLILGDPNVAKKIDPDIDLT